MKNALLLLALVACEQSKAPDAPTTTTASVAPVASAPPIATTTTTATATTPTPSATATDAPIPHKRPLAKEGEVCSGIAAIQCAEGLTCKKVGKPYPDQSGTCQK